MNKLFLPLSLLLLWPTIPAFGADGDKPVARLTSADGSFLLRATDAEQYKPNQRGAIVNGHSRAMGLPGAKLNSADATVELVCRADFVGNSPLPILETAFELLEPKGVDLALHFERGRIDLKNIRSEGVATVSVSFADVEWLITLDEPDSQVAVEIVSRWPSGTRFRRQDNESDEVPATAAVLIVTSGNVAISDGQRTLALSAPPGPSMIEWSNADSSPIAAKRLDQLPEWAGPQQALSPEVSTGRAATESFRAVISEKGLNAALDQFLQSDDPVEKRVGLVVAGAVDDLPRLTDSAGGSADAEVWDFGVTVLRHWLGRSAKQPAKLYEYLHNSRQISETRSGVIVQLLLGFSPVEQSRPETFEVLIEYLLSEQPAIRNLAAWHLSRLAPNQPEVAFKPNATDDEIEKTYRAWKSLIPAGTVPKLSAPEPKQLEPKQP